jgi:hypothetical protein
VEVFPSTTRKLPLHGRDAKNPCVYGKNYFNTRLQFPNPLLPLPSNGFHGFHGMISMGAWNDFCL